jgi:hypothetical protein
MLGRLIPQRTRAAWTNHLARIALLGCQLLSGSGRRTCRMSASALESSALQSDVLSETLEDILDGKVCFARLSYSLKQQFQLRT